MPVTLTVVGFPLEISVGFPIFAVGAGSGLPAHEAPSKKPLGGDRNWRELTTPGAGTVPAGEKVLSFESSFHIRMEPSHEPKE